MDSISFSQSSYLGYEDDVLAIRNKNRPQMVTRPYLDWRYLDDRISPPVVFWIHRYDGARVGMASLIFRRYWIDNKLHKIGVLGDISLNEELRGKGISRELFHCINKYVDENNIISFVIPNQIASRGLSSVGWRKKGPFLSYVWIIDPTEILIRYHVPKKISPIAGKVYRIYALQRVSPFEQVSSMMHPCDGFDETFDSLWNEIPKHGLILSDRSAASLQWRYMDHPHKKFEVMKFIKHDRLLGYIIYAPVKANTCQIYDFIAINDEHLYSMVGAFIHMQIKHGMNSTIRVTINEDNCYAGLLTRMGFIQRKEDNIFQSYTSSSNQHLYDGCKWFITIGDKDV